ncbi:MAG: RidA family protein [Spirochaetales bacterium]|nr:RidA family protein [Spirochaetales bacterium]
MGYSRAVRSGPFIAVSGTVGTNPDGSYSPYLVDQVERCLQIIQSAIEALGGKMEQVIRTRIFIKDITHWEEVARVHGKIFGSIRPACTLVEVHRLIDAGALLEMEADAFVI